jgi:hypothetical protein
MNKIILRLALIFALPAASALLAQTTAGFGAISGVVQDATGSVVPAAKVVVENSSKGIHRELETNAEGVFSASTLVPASGYSVTMCRLPATA